MVNHTVAQAVNASVNATAPDAGAAAALFFTATIPELLSRLFVFVAAPFLHLDMWWLLVHLLLTFVLFEFYFERHHDEELGWSAALANSIVMVFIALELLRAVYHHEGSPFHVAWWALMDVFELGLFADKTIVIGLCVLLLVFGLLSAVINYFHFLPRQVAYLISGHKTVNLLAYFLIVVVFRWNAGEPLPLDWLTLVALVLYGLLLWSLLFMINRKRTKKAASKGRLRLFK